MQTAAEQTPAPAARVDHFATLGLPRKLGLDAPALKRTFHALSKKNHPDLFHNAPREERERSVAFTTRANNAFNCLKDRVRRLEHLLELEGRALESTTDQVPPQFFELVMDVNMAAQDARGGDAGARKSLGRLAARIEGEEGRILARLGEAERAWDAGIDAGAAGAERGALADRLQGILKELLYLGRLQRTIRAAAEAGALP